MPELLTTSCRSPLLRLETILEPALLRNGITGGVDLLRFPGSPRPEPRGELIAGPEPKT